MTETKETFFLDEVISIETVGIVDTYDFTIPETHCFFANGILVHNSIEEDADMVLFVYRPGEYDDNIDKSETDIILAKNRQGARATEQQVLFNAKRMMFELRQF